MTRILIADDHTIFREGIKRILEKTDGFEVVAEASTGSEALDKAHTLHPDVVLLDVSMPGPGGIETARELKRREPRLHVLMLTVHPEDYYAIRCLREGVDGYLTKDVAPEQLVQAIRKVQSGGKYVGPLLAERLAMSLGGGEKPPHESLSERELEVLRRIGSGKSVSDIANELSLSVKTISTYRSRILMKMNMRNNAELMLYVLHEGLDE